MNVGRSQKDNQPRALLARYTGFGAAGKWEDLNCVAHFRFDVDAYLANSGSRYKTVEVLHSQSL